jgi:hypothetical protein
VYTSPSYLYKLHLNALRSGSGSRKRRSDREYSLQCGCARMPVAAQSACADAVHTLAAPVCHICSTKQASRSRDTVLARRPYATAQQAALGNGRLTSKPLSCAIYQNCVS